MDARRWVWFCVDVFPVGEPKCRLPWRTHSGGTALFGNPALFPPLEIAWSARSCTLVDRSLRSRKNYLFCFLTPPWFPRFVGNCKPIDYGGRMLQLANPAPIRSVHLQQANRSPAYRSASDNDDSVALKVVIPLVLARMKQP